MSSDNEKVFTKANLDLYLRELVKEFRRLNGTPITYADVDRAVCDLYGGWETISEDSQAFIKGVMAKGDYDRLYAAVSAEEARAKDALVTFDKNYPGALNEDNANEIIKRAAEKREDRASVLEKLRAARQKDQKD